MLTPTLKSVGGGRVPPSHTPVHACSTPMHAGVYPEHNSHSDWHPERDFITDIMCSLRLACIVLLCILVSPKER